MDTKEFIQFKVKLESMNISTLIDQSSVLLLKKEGQDHKEDPTTIQKSDVYWMLLEKKIRSTNISKGRNVLEFNERTPSFQEVIQIKTPKTPPYSVLRTLVDMCQSATDYAKLAETYPDCLRIKFQNGDSLLHRVINIGGYKSKDLINLIICNTMIMSNNIVTEEREDVIFGGLTVENDKGISPLIRLFGLAAHYNPGYPHCKDQWIWLTRLIQRIVHIQLHYCNKKNKKNIYFDETIFLNDCCSKQLTKTPLLHAVLEMSCPIGMMNRILDATTTDELFERDSFGRTPLVVALSKKKTPAEIALKLFCKTPVKLLYLLQNEKEGDLPLHRIIKSGIKYHNAHENELTLIGTIVEFDPQALYALDDIYRMPPFALACIDGVWSLDVIYGLLRTSPGAIELLI